ncbi:hypothetical protein FHS83_000694 [Rhizomicrobium palustre]|uniref:Uncharacterized protein n=1 Tax=Rhizomicrobium palustre TaxID=189966 RepID=A0A846MVI0_9PROT|nr:hypothetical protein [Rhizomicrobium palustre]NIK87376.1 hypothetical protein [Rhizomicrobium palustre]
MINREFTSDFKTRSRWRRWVIALSEKLTGRRGRTATRMASLLNEGQVPLLNNLERPACTDRLFTLCDKAPREGVALMADIA